MSLTRRSLYTLLIFFVNIFLVTTVLFIIFMTRISHYIWGFSNGSYVKYNVFPSRIVSEGNCISTSASEFENCNEMIEHANSGINISISIISTFFPSNSIEGLIKSINSSMVILTCLLAGYDIFLMFSTLVLLIRDYTNYKKRLVHIFSIVLAGISFLCIISSLFYWTVMHITWEKLFLNSEKINTIQILSCSLRSGYYILIVVVVFTLIEIIVLLKALPIEDEEIKYSIIS